MNRESVRLARFLVLLFSLASAAPAPARDGLYGVASRGTSAVAVGDSGRAIFSSQAPHNDGWARAVLNSIVPVRGVTTGANDYVAVGLGGFLVRTTNEVGNNWIPRSSRTNADLFGIAHGGDRLIAVGDSGTIIRSASQEADDWTPLAGIPTDRRLRAVSGGTLFCVTVGDSGTILWSATTNTSSWTVADVVPTTSDLLGVAEGPGNPSRRFWCVGRGGTLLRSQPNARDWEAQISGVTVDLNAIAFALLSSGWIGVAVGDGGTILYSNGGATWTQVDTPTQQNLYAVAYTGSGAGGGFVAAGEESTLLWSELGSLWQDVVVPVRPTSWGSIRNAWAPASEKR
jgi:hypothetical protein